MSLKSSKKLVVSDLHTTLKFYSDILRFEVLFHDLNLNVAMVQYHFSQTLLLVGDPTLDVTQWLTSAYDTIQPGKYIYFKGENKLQEYNEILSDHDQYEINWVEKEWGDIILNVTDPDGYNISFWRAKDLSFDEILNYYEDAPRRLQEALKGLSEEDLNLRRAPEKWSIRQIVLHIVDSDATSLAMIKFALAEPGRSINSNAYNPDVWAEGLDYKNRSIKVGLELFTAIRKHIGGLLRHLPNALDRYVKISNGPQLNVKERIRPLISHPLGHIEQILETRHIHGK